MLDWDKVKQSKQVDYQILQCNLGIEISYIGPEFKRFQQRVPARIDSIFVKVNDDLLQSMQIHIFVCF